MNPSVGDSGEGEFAGVDDAFLAGFEAWGELGQMQGSLLGTGPGQASGSAASTSDAGNSTGNGGTVGGAGGAGGMTYRSGLGGSLQSFLREAGIYADNSNGLGPDSFKDGFDGSGKDFLGCAGGSSSSSSNSNNTIGNSIAGSKPSVARINKQQQDVASCKMESMDDMDDDAENEHDGIDSEGNDDEHDYLEEHDDLDIGDGAGGSRGARDGTELRGLGRIFGMGTHPVVAEAQARAEALVHGLGGKGGSTGKGAADAAEKKRKRAVLSKEERAKQNRDRNREHARNTRLRKKAFVEELKKQVEELVANREREERERRAESRRDSSLRDIRVQVLLTFLEYRGRGETSRHAWQSVLDEQFEMRMPLTPYRTFPPHQVQGGIRVIKGVEGVVGDTLSLAMATRGSTIVAGRPNRQDAKATPSLQQQAGRSKGKGKGSDDASPGVNGRVKREAASSSTSGTSRPLSSRMVGATTTEPCLGSKASPRAVGIGKVGGRPGVAAAIPTRVYYVVDPKEVMANKNAFMCPFVARSSQILVPGMLRCTFSMKSNRLSSLHLSFDPTVPAKQLQLARANLAGRSTHEMTSLMMGVTPPPQPAMADEGMGNQVQSSSSVSGRGSSSGGVRQREGQVQEQGFPEQDEGVLKSVLEDIREWRVSSTLVDDPHEGKSYLRVYPLNGDTPGVTHFIGVLESLAASQGADTSGSVLPPLVSSGETVVSSVPNNSATTGYAGTVDVDPRVTVEGHAKAEVGEESSSQREIASSEGETSSDSTGSRGRHASNDAMTYNSTVSPSGGEVSSGSGGSDDGTATSSGRGRTSRSLSATTTAASDGSSASGYETRRSTRRSVATSPAPDPANHVTTATTVGRPGVVVAGSGTRVRVRSDGSKRGRA